jgi:D-alanyl-D-alanine dipeptidase
MIVLSDPRVAAVPLRDCAEPLVEVESVASVRLDPREQDPAGAYGRVRLGVLNRLSRAAEALPEGIGFLVVEGHRSATEQRRRFASYTERLRSSGISDPAELRRRASSFVSPVEVAPHCAGAAIDLTLIDANGFELDMGCAVNGHRTGDEALCPLDAPGLTAVALGNRRLLTHVLVGAGLVNYPSEWWHWSYGDRYWALLTHAEAAVYGPV